MTVEVRSADLLARNIIETPGVMQELQAKPAETLAKLTAQAKEQVPRVLEQDRVIYRIVVGSLGFVVIAVVLGVIALSFKATGATVAVPDVLTALGSAAIGALAGILAPSPSSRG